MTTAEVGFPPDLAIVDVNQVEWRKAANAIAQRPASAAVTRGLGLWLARIRQGPPVLVVVLQTRTRDSIASGGAAADIIRLQMESDTGGGDSRATLDSVLGHTVYRLTKPSTGLVQAQFSRKGFRVLLEAKGTAADLNPVLTALLRGDI